MDILPLLCIVSVAFTGLTKGAGVLPDVLNAAVGETVIFTTTLTPPEKPFLTVGWKFGDKDIITSNVENITAPEYEDRITLFTSTGSLELRNLTLNDSGEYTVVILPEGETFKNGTTVLKVYEPVSNAEVTASSTDLVGINSSVRLSCSSSGSSLSFLWMNGSSVVTAWDRAFLLVGDSILVIHTVTRYDQGPFRCRVSNPVSTDISDPVNLSVSFGPKNIILTLSPSQEYYKEGSNISLSCSADSKPAASFQWFLNGDPLSDTGPEITLMNIQESQSGHYSCQAFNSKTLRYQTSAPSVVTVLANQHIPLGSCTVGGITGIVIALVVLVGASFGAVCYSSDERIHLKTFSNRNAATRTGGGGQNNTAYSGSQELNWADMNFFQNRDGGTVQLGSQDNSSEYAHVRVNSSPPAASSPPSYDECMQQSTLAVVNIQPVHDIYCHD